MAAAPAFQQVFGRNPEVMASAPGRVNLIGEHTDYNGGCVLPVALPLRTRVELAARTDDTVRAWSATVASDVSAYTLGNEARGRDWLDYVQGITTVLRHEGFSLRGFDLWVASDLPLGGGLASSAALEVSVLRALRSAFDLPLDDVRLAALGQRAENGFVGARVGIMDQMAASLGEETSALFLDTRTLRYERVPLPPGAELAVIGSSIIHRHADGGYNARRTECERACTLLGVAELRDLSMDDLPRTERLPPPLDRRARHVVTENARVLAMVKALRAGDLTHAGTLLVEGHASLRDDYAVSLPEIDLLVELACAEPGVYGARLTGGGFGGSVVLLAQRGHGRAAAARVARAYATRTGHAARVLVPVEGQEPAPFRE